MSLPTGASNQPPISREGNPNAASARAGCDCIARSPLAVSDSCFPEIEVDGARFITRWFHLRRGGPLTTFVRSCDVICGATYTRSRWRRRNRIDGCPLPTPAAARGNTRSVRTVRRSRYDARQPALRLSADDEARASTTGSRRSAWCCSPCPGSRCSIQACTSSRACSAEGHDAHNPSVDRRRAVLQLLRSVLTLLEAQSLGAHGQCLAWPSPRRADRAR
jgi:hypothetical protein